MGCTALTKAFFTAIILTISISSYQASIPLKFVMTPGVVHVLEGTKATLNWTIAYTDSVQAPGDDWIKHFVILWRFLGTYEWYTEVNLMLYDTTMPGGDLYVWLEKMSRITFFRGPNSAVMTLSDVYWGDYGNYSISVWNNTGPNQPLLLDDLATIVLVKVSDVEFNISLDSDTWSLSVVNNGTNVTLPVTQVTATTPSSVLVTLELSRKLPLPRLLTVTTPDETVNLTCDLTYKCQRQIFLSVNSERQHTFIISLLDFNIQNLNVISVFAPTEFQLFEDFRFTKTPEKIFVLYNTTVTLIWSMVLSVKNSSTNPRDSVNIAWKYLGTPSNRLYQDIMTRTPEKLLLWQTDKTDRVRYSEEAGSAGLTIDKTIYEDNGDYEISLANTANPGQIILRDVATLEVLKLSDVEFSISLGTGTWILSVVNNGTNVTLPVTHVTATTPSSVLVTLEISHQLPLPRLLTVTTHDETLKFICDMTYKCQRKIFLSVNSEQQRTLIISLIDFNIQNLDVIDIVAPIEFQLFEDFRFTKTPGTVFVLYNTTAFLSWSLVSSAKNSTTNPTDSVNIAWKYLGTPSNRLYQDIIARTPEKLLIWRRDKSDRVGYSGEAGNTALTISKAIQKDNGEYEITVANTGNPGQIILRDVATLEVLKLSDLSLNVSVNEQVWKLNAATNGTNVTLPSMSVTVPDNVSVRVTVRRTAPSLDVVIRHTADVTYRDMCQRARECFRNFAFSVDGVRGKPVTLLLSINFHVQNLPVFKVSVQLDQTVTLNTGQTTSKARYAIGICVAVAILPAAIFWRIWPYLKKKQNDIKVEELERSPLLDQSRSPEQHKVLWTKTTNEAIRNFDVCSENCDIILCHGQSMSVLNRDGDSMKSIDLHYLAIRLCSVSIHPHTRNLLLLWENHQRNQFFISRHRANETLMDIWSKQKVQEINLGWGDQDTPQAAWLSETEVVVGHQDNNGEWFLVTYDVNSFRQVRRMRVRINGITDISMAPEGDMLYISDHDGKCIHMFERSQDQSDLSISLTYQCNSYNDIRSLCAVHGRKVVVCHGVQHTGERTVSVSLWSPEHGHIRDMITDLPDHCARFCGRVSENDNAIVIHDGDKTIWKYALWGYLEEPISPEDQHHVASDTETTSSN